MTESTVVHRKATLWPRARRRVATAVVLTAAITAIYVGVLGGAPRYWVLSAGYLAAALLALTSPQAIAGQVAIGIALAWSLLPGREGTEAFVILPVIVAVVMTAELLAMAARLGMIVARDPRPDIRRLAIAVTLAALTSVATLAIGLLPGPGGLAATAIAAGACLLLALLLVRGQRERT